MFRLTSLPEEEASYPEKMTVVTFESCANQMHYNTFSSLSSPRQSGWQQCHCSMKIKSKFLSLFPQRSWYMSIVLLGEHIASELFHCYHSSHKTVGCICFSVSILLRLKSHNLSESGIPRIFNIFVYSLLYDSTY